MSFRLSGPSVVDCVLADAYLLLSFRANYNGKFCLTCLMFNLNRVGYGCLLICLLFEALLCNCFVFDSSGLLSEADSPIPCPPPDFREDSPLKDESVHCSDYSGDIEPVLSRWLGYLGLSEAGLVSKLKYFGVS